MLINWLNFKYTDYASVLILKKKFTIFIFPPPLLSILNKQFVNWVIFVILSVIWGSSFILMKAGLQVLSSYQVASLRIISAGIVLLPLSVRNFKSIPKNKLGLVFLSGFLGSLLPAYLFCIAETHINSALAGMLNALTPIFAIVFGALFFKYTIPGTKIIGIIIGFIGSLCLLLSQGAENSGNLYFMAFAIIATLLYGINVNMVHKYLHEVRSLTIASVALSLCAIPAFIVLFLSGYFQQQLSSKEFLESTLASCILGMAGTADATIFFYVLIKRAGVIFSSMVTYGIPFVAILWGLFAHENITWNEMGSLLIILMGVYLANRGPKTVAVPD